MYEGTTGIQALDLFFRKIARDQGATLGAVSNEILEFVKSGGDDDLLAEERVMLGGMLENTQGHVGVMVNHLLSSMNDDPEQIYKVGLHANPLLETLAEVVIAWQLLRQAEVALPLVETDPFYRGKVETARYLVRDVAPKTAARRAAAEAEDGALMELPVEAF
ncbi:MAG: hypothetical protein GEU79_07545 [Acidimicrobiia bacterium]|nr:hypothetical protein [Acidimicrobiia bacterium]